LPQTDVRCVYVRDLEAVRDLCELVGVLEHDADEGDKVEACEGLGAALGLLDEPSEACGPVMGSMEVIAAANQDMSDARL
jgi:hypothetical protein